MSQTPQDITADKPAPPTKMAYPTIAQSWGILGLFVAITFTYAIPLLVLTLLGIDAQTGPFTLLNYTIPLAAIILVTRFWWKKNPKNNEFLKFRPFPISILPLMLVLTIVSILIVNEITSWVPMPDFLEQLFRDLFESNIWGFLTVGIAAAFLEEILFRGIILEGMLRNYSPWKAILWSSLFFGIFHLNPWQLVGGFMIGVFIGYLYWKTRSIWAGILIHFLNNTIAYVMFLKYPEVETFPEWFQIGWFGRLLIFVIGAIIIWQSYLFLEKYFKKRNPQENELEVEVK